MECLTISLGQFRHFGNRYCPICTESYHFDMSLLREAGREARLPISCTARSCGYSFCYECAKKEQVRYLQEIKILSKEGLPESIACPLCKTKRSIQMSKNPKGATKTTENPLINRHACKLLEELEKILPLALLQDEEQEEEDTLKRSTTNLQPRSRLTLWEEVQVTKAADANDNDGDSSDYGNDNSDNDEGDELNRKMPARTTRSQSARARTSTNSIRYTDWDDHDADDAEDNIMPAEVATRSPSRSETIGLKHSDDEFEGDDSDRGVGYSSERPHYGIKFAASGHQKKTSTAPPVRADTSSKHHCQKECKDDNHWDSDLDQKVPARSRHQDRSSKSGLHPANDDDESDHNNNDSELDQTTQDGEAHHFPDYENQSDRKMPARKGATGSTSQVRQRLPAMQRSPGTSSSQVAAAARAVLGTASPPKRKRSTGPPQPVDVIELMDSDSEDDQPNTPHNDEKIQPSQQNTGNAPSIAQKEFRTSPPSAIQTKRSSVQSNKKQRHSTTSPHSNARNRPREGVALLLPDRAKYSGWNGFDEYISDYNISDSNRPKSLPHVLELMDVLFRVVEGEDTFYLALFKKADSPSGSGKREGWITRVELRRMEKSGRFPCLEWHESGKPWGPPTKEDLRSFIKLLMRLNGAPELAESQTFE